jgi:RNA polymerase sigma-32 factor
MTTSTLPVSMALPSAAGSLESYIQSVNRFPLLTEEEELRLARGYRGHEDLDAARQLVLSHLRLVVSIARGYLGYGLPHSDLIQEGNVGLMKAVKRFDPERGVRLVSFAVHWIRAEIHEYILRNWRVVKIATTKAQRKLFFNLRSMKKGHGALTRQETDAMASELRVKPSDVSEMEMRLGGQDVSLEPVGDDDEASFGPIAYLSNHDDEPRRILEQEETERLRSEGLERALGSLDPRSRRIIEARWLREQDTLTLHDLAAEFGVSAERIRQIEAQAMKKMRGLMPATA